MFRFHVFVSAPLLRITCANFFPSSLFTKKTPLSQTSEVSSPMKTVSAIL